MTDIRIAGEQDIPELKEIWTDVFCDVDPFIDLFFSELFASATVFVAEQDGLLIGSAYVLDIFTLKNSAIAQPCPYIYGLGVLPEFRGLGIGKKLALACRDHCSEKYGLSCLVPADNGLFDYYKLSADYVAAFNVSEYELLEPEGAVKAEISTIDATEYGRLREALLASCPHLEFSDSALRFLESLCKYYDGGLYLLKACDAYAVAACEYSSDGFRIKELLCSNENSRGFAASLLWNLETEQCIYRTPANEKHPENAKAFGMLSKAVKGGPCYFGPAFD